ncbi:hypothetical protein K438DRAFT_1876652 [Mycena galopus ATCC 62051]|nr:hypothetical protein K438DRAFT_1876652 [Mycena galopus ATCC 62051]
MEHLVDSALFDLYWKLMLREISGTCVQIFLYAIFLILWIIAIRTLGRRETAGKNVLLTFSWALAALGTTQVVLCIPITIETLRLLHELVQQRTDLNPGPVPAPQLRTYNSLEVAEEVVFVINKLAPLSSVFCERLILVPVLRQTSSLLSVLLDWTNDNR